MNAPATIKQPSEIALVRNQIDDMAPQFMAALPAHIPVERFARVIMTALQNEPGLLKCSRKSLFNAAMKAAQDGLLPDGREGAMVPFGGDVTWMPMIGGIRKKVRNSGEIATWDVHAVYENDAFEYELGDEPFIRHKPCLDGDRGKLIAVYSIATLKSGEKSRDVMSVSEVEKIRALSKGKNTPWNNPTFYPEMAKKTVARRHSKMLPMSSDLDDLIRRDDHLYDLDGAREEAQTERPKSLAGKLKALADFSNDGEVIDNETGEVSGSAGGSHPSGGADKKSKKSEPGPSSEGSENAEKKASTASATASAKQPSADDNPPDPVPADGDQSEDRRGEAYRAGRDAKITGLAKKAIPAEYRADPDLLESYLEGYDETEVDD